MLVLVTAKSDTELFFAWEILLSSVIIPPSIALYTPLSCGYVTQGGGTWETF
jgi:hypothetical protein